MAYFETGVDVRGDNFNEETQIEDDLSIVPLAKDSFAICELCGRVGRRGQFYPRNNKFCSLRCNASNARKRHCNWRFKLMEGAEHMAGMIPLEPLPQLQQWQATLNDIQAGPIKQSTALIANSYEWKDELFGCDFLAAPVSLFKHAPLHEMWDNTFEGMKVEVKNTDCDNYSEKLGDYFWVATVLKIKGYMGLLRYEGFGSDDSKDFWVNLCCSEVHPVGWCATRGKPLIPPTSIEDKYTDWKKFLVKQLTGARTLPANFYTKLNDSIKSRFSIGSIMEVVDKNRISQVKVASVCEIIGKRLHVKYYDSSPEDNGFWCHEDSPLIHPVGWAFRVGHPLDAPQSYCHRVATGRLLPNDTTLDMFYMHPTNEPPLFAEGMKLEAIDPLNLSAVCAATVMQILNEGYMMIRIDCYPPDASGGDWFCYHQRSPCIFPVGFALANDIPLVPPHGYVAGEFSWEQYLSVFPGGVHAAGGGLFASRPHVVSHGFVAGMRLECADLMDPRLVCVATIARVVADLLKVHFDGWGGEYDQWLWAHSTDMYPVGWCRAVGHRLEGPLQAVPPRLPRKPIKPPRRRRRQPGTKSTTQPPHTTEESSQNSDMADTKSLSPPTSVSEVSADTCHTETREENMAANDNVKKFTMVEMDDSAIENEMVNKMEEVDHMTEVGEMAEGCQMAEIDQMAEVDQMTEVDQMAEVDQIPKDNKLTEVENMAEIERVTEDLETEKQGTEDEILDTNRFIEPEADKMDVEEKNDQITEVTENLIENNDDIPPSPETSQDTPQPLENSPKEPSLPLPPPPSPPKSDKVIPRLVNTTVPLDLLNSIEPESWTTNDVATFLTVNDCQPYCDNFSNITGPALLQLTKDEIIELLKMKVGPSLKIFDLIQQLKCKIRQPQSRLLGSFK